MSKQPAKGKCYQTTFQIMQDLGEREDQLPLIFEKLRVQLNQVNIEDHIRLVHGEAFGVEGFTGHAWIELFDQAIFDPATDAENPYELKNFYDRFKCRNCRKFSRSQMFQILQCPELGTQWARLSDEQLEGAYQSKSPADYCKQNFVSLPPSQTEAARMDNRTQVGVGQPAIGPESKPEGDQQPQPESGGTLSRGRQAPSVQ